MEGFKEYLQQRRFMQSTINGHLLNVGYFLKWIENNGLHEAENLQYTDLLNYVNYEQKQNKVVSTINLRISSISKYFEFLKEEGLVNRNPARTLRIKGKVKTIIQNPLSYDELLQLYNNYKALEKNVPNHLQEKTTLAHQRNIIIVGLLVWQGLHSGELEKLEVNYINLDEGKIYVPGGARSNSRTLQLHVQQVVQLHTYIYGGVHTMHNNKLFKGRMCDIVQALLEELKGLNPIIKNAQHIRASVILNWLKQYNKRQVQYMAGHRYIDSTERYAIQETDSLTDLLVKHHPFG
jgi:site-specific recombinase XerD